MSRNHDSPGKSARWHHNRFVWVAVVLLAVSAGAVVLVSSVRSEPQPEEL